MTAYSGLVPDDVEQRADQIETEIEEITEEIVDLEQKQQELHNELGDVVGPHLD